eukprot:scaffold16648_cov338-Ochromonas_danica.AAC.1
MMSAYLIFSTRFVNMDRGFRSPFGMVGALMAICFWLLLFVINLYYQTENDRMWEGLSLLVFFVVCMVYYVAFASGRQFFSKEEQEKFLKAYIVNANKGKKKGRGGGGPQKTGIRSKLSNKIWGKRQSGARVVSSPHLEGFSSDNHNGNDSNNLVETRSLSTTL